MTTRVGADVLELSMLHVTISTRRKLLSIAMASFVFAVLAGLVALAEERPPQYGISTAILTGVGVGVFEEFYVQTLRGRWLRLMHPVRSILIYTLVVVCIFLASGFTTHLIFTRLTFGRGVLEPPYELSAANRHLPFVLPIFILLSIIGVSVMRFAHFVGIETMFHLMAGTYHRPVEKRMIVMFVDMNGSTEIATRLGARRMSALVSKFLFDIAKPITDAGGDIYLYKGDGLIALWDWTHAVYRNAILRAIDSMHAAVRREGRTYTTEFGITPTFRIGVHGGDVVVGVQGDMKWSIGVYGDTINIAARTEDAAKTRGVPCVISAEVAQALDNGAGRIVPLGEERVRGVDEPISIAEYRLMESAPPQPLPNPSREAHLVSN